MRFKFVLERLFPGRFMPLNDQYAVSGWTYRIQDADPEYSLFLQKRNYKSNNRRRKLSFLGKIPSYSFAIACKRIMLKSAIATIILHLRDEMVYSASTPICISFGGLKYKAQFLAMEETLAPGLCRKPTTINAHLYNLHSIGNI